MKWVLAGLAAERGTSLRDLPVPSRARRSRRPMGRSATGVRWRYLYSDA
jgi:hypothetical protein